jgi:hypothetical protein
MKTFKEYLAAKYSIVSETPLTHFSHDFVSTPEYPEILDKDKFQVYKHPTDNPDFINPNNVHHSKFSERDKAIISHPRTARILEEKLKKIGINLNILFIEDRNRPQGFGVNYINDYLKNKNINKANSITFLLHNSAGGQLLTPWMILHRFGHALMESLDERDDTFSSKFRQIFTKYFGYQNTIPSSHPLARDFFDNLHNIFLFKSTSPDSFSDNFPPLGAAIGELIHELVAEYLWNGRIRINPSALGEEEISQYKEGINEAEKLINQLLRHHVGSIVTTFV